MKVLDKINLFVEHKEFEKAGEKKIYYKLTTSIATKQESGDYLRLPVDIIVNPKKYPDAVLAKLDPMKMYVANIINGWLMVTDYLNKDGKQVKKLAIYIEEMKLTDCKPIDQDKRNKALQGAKGTPNGQNPDLPF